jgi:DNA-binding CsgD family transcriptional regulator
VSKHIEHILPKLGVHTRAQAVARAAGFGLLGRSA